MKRRFLKGAVALTTALSLATVSNTKATDRVTTMVNNMSLDQKIGQMLMPDFRKWQKEGETAQSDFTVMNDEVKAIVDKYDFGGVILFAENVKETAQTLTLTHDLQKAAVTNTAGNGNTPLFITIDQEGGIVYRLGSGTALPGNMAIGATRNPDYALKTGQIIGRELSALGLNVNFSPVLDVNNNPNNSVIGLRSFSNRPELVAELGVNMIKGLQQYNISTSAKHFPGHGDTATDSHTGLPSVNKSYDDLKALELVPFQAAMDNGVDMVMTAHIQYPQIEKDQVVSKKDGEKIYVPATLSDDIITGLVRNKMKYDGVVITDAMNMAAIADHFGESEAAIMAIQADVDIVLMPTILRSKADLTKLDTIINNIKAAITDGRITMENIDNSVTRILKLKEKRGILDYSKTDLPLDQKLAKASQEVGSKLNRSLEREISEAAVTVVKNENVLPLQPKANEKVLLLAPYANELPGLELGMRRLMAENYISHNVKVETFRYADKMNFDDIKAKIKEANYVVVISEISNTSRLVATNWLTKYPTDIVNAANELNKPNVVMSISKPYDVANYPAAKAIVAVYGAKGMDPTEALRPDKAFGPNIPAGVQVIFGGADAKGILPIDIPEVKDGTINAASIKFAFGSGEKYARLPQKLVQDDDLTLPHVIYSNNAFPENTKLTTQQLSKDDKGVKFDIKPVVENTSVQPNEMVTVKLPFEAGKKVEKVLHDGTSVAFEVEGNFAVVKVAHFSEFAVVYAQPTTQPSDPVKPVETPKTTTPTAEVKPTTAKTDVKTSDLTAVYGLMLCGAFIALRKLSKKH